MLWLRFQSEALSLEKKSGSKAIQKMLFKGSDHHNSNSIIEDTGFDHKFMQTGKLGTAIYFSKSAEYAEKHYGHNLLNDDGTQSGLHTLFLNYVLFSS